MEMSELTREVEELRSEKEASHQFDGWRNQTRTQYSLSPDPSSARYPNVRKHLELMNHEYKKAFWVCLNCIFLSFILFGDVHIVFLRIGDLNLYVAFS